jgi:membrane-associated phospholipid phosphatase
LGDAPITVCLGGGRATIAGMIARTPLVVPLAALVAFLVLLALVAADWRPLDRLDLAVSRDLRGFGRDHPGLIDVVRVATDVAATVPFVAAGIASTALLLARGLRAPAWFCAWVTVSIPVLWGLMHWGLHRPRPADGFVFVDSNGFPSGHTSHAAAAGLVAVLLLWPRVGRRGRMVAVAAAAAFALLIGATRVVLLAHWPVDVLGAYLLVLAVVPLLAHLVMIRASPKS